MNSWLSSLMPHLMLAPILLPMLTAGVIMLLKEDRPRIKSILNVGSAVLGLLIAIWLMRWTHQQASPAAINVYLSGNWPAPFGIVLVLDRLSSMMVVLCSILSVAGVIYSIAHWNRAGVNFHAIFQLQIMGINGVFLTGDLFNLFVFIEILLAASYGLLLHGSGRQRVQAGLHYIAINLVTSVILLIGISMLYGITGTLNLADLSVAVQSVADKDRVLLHVGAGVLGVAVLIKAAVWPLNFWLVPAYSAATAPAGVMFSILTKVGVYIVIRLWTLIFGYDAGLSAQYGGSWITYAGMLSVAIGTIGLMGSQKLGNMAGYSAVISSGTLLAALGFGQNLMTAGLLYYMVSSTLAVAACFLLADLMDRWRNGGKDYAPYEENDIAPFLSRDLSVDISDQNLDDREQALIGRAIPAAVALLGLSFMACTLLIAGMPPFSGFIGKFSILSGLLNPLGIGVSQGQYPEMDGWILIGLLIASGFFALIAYSRAGIRHFWAAHGRPSPMVRVVEGIPLAILLGACAALTVNADNIMRYMQVTAHELYAPDDYTHTVLGQKPIPYPTQQQNKNNLPEAKEREGGL